VQRRGTPLPPTRAATRSPSATAASRQAGIAAAAAAISLATDHHAVRCAVPQRGDDRNAVTNLDGAASLPSPPQVAPAGGSVVVVPAAGAVAVQASTEAGDRHASGASVLALAGAGAAEAAFSTSGNG